MNNNFQKTLILVFEEVVQPHTFEIGIFFQVLAHYGKREYNLISLNFFSRFLEIIWTVCDHYVPQLLLLLLLWLKSFTCNVHLVVNFFPSNLFYLKRWFLWLDMRHKIRSERLLALFERIILFPGPLSLFEEIITCHCCWDVI